MDSKTRGRTTNALALAFAVGSLLTTRPATAGPDADAPTDRVIVAAIPDDWPPEYVTRPDGTPGGLAVEILEAVARDADYSLRFVRRPTLGDATAAVVNGEADVVPSIGVTASRGARLLLTAPYQTFDVAYYVRDESGVRSAADLGASTVGVVETNVGEQLVDATSVGTVQAFSTIGEAILALLAGDIDALVYPRPVVDALTRRSGLSGRLRPLPEPLARIDRAIGVQRERPDLHRDLDAALRAFRRTPDFAELQERWLGAPTPVWTRRRILTALAIIAGVVALGMLVGRHLALRTVAGRLREEIAERERVAAALRDEERLLRSVTEGIQEGLLLLDGNRRIAFVNRAACDVLGRPREELMGRAASDVVASAHADDDEARLESCFSGRAEEYEVDVVRGDGQRRRVAIHGAPLRADDGRVTGAATTFRDITAQREMEAELARRDAELQRARELERVGRLSGAVAHDFNNLLTVIGGYARELADRLEGDAPAQESLAHVQEAARRATELTQGLLAFSRQQVLRPCEVDLAELLEGARAHIQRVTEPSCRVETDCPSETVVVRADPAQVEFILASLVERAVEALPDGGTIHVRCAAVTLPDEALPPESSLAGELPGPGHYGLLEVTDEGRPIEATERDQLFEPALRAGGDRSRLALAALHGAATQSGGSVRLAAHPTGATCFQVLLPAGDGPASHETTAADGRDDAEAAPQAVGAGRVLLVEDEPAIRSLEAGALRRDGFTVVEAGTAEEALSEVEHDYENELVALVTDVVLPGQTGDELARKVERLRPELPILFVSGFAASVPEEELTRPNRAFLGKPVDMRRLRAVVRELIDESRRREDPGES